MKKTALLFISVLASACGTVSEVGQSTAGQDDAISTQSSNEKASELTPLDNSESDKITVTEVLVPKSGLVESLASQFSWENHLEQPEVQTHLKNYQKHPDQLKTILNRASFILPIVSNEILQRGLPTELAFLPIVESGFQPAIFSGSGAAGLWQIMPATGRHLGLKMDWWYDERLDIQASTIKALDYLEYLNKQFKGDWELAISAYNGGEGHVRSRMRRAKSSNFWDLSLKRETEAYLPRLLAIAEIFKDPQKYGVTIPLIEPETELRSLTIDHQIDLRLAASKAGMEYADLKALNPDFQRWVSPPTGTYTILIPSENMAELKSSLDDLRPDQLTSWDHYKVKSGDTLIDIAREFGTTLRALMAVNELKNSRIYERQELLIPKSDVSSIAGIKPNTVKELYIVQSGDSLWTIANRNNLTVDKLQRLNNINSKGVIRPGQVLVLNEYSDSSATVYEVKRGDSLSEIAMLFDVNIADLKSWNALGQEDLIYPGQMLRVKTPAGNTI